MVTIEEAGKLKKADLLEHYSQALGEIARLRDAAKAPTKPQVRTSSVSSAPVVGPAFGKITCEAHPRVTMANKHGQCPECNNLARGKRPAN